MTLDGQIRRAVLQIVGPPQRNGLGWFCWVRVEPLLQGWTKIYGIDADQVEHLSARFLLLMLGGTELCDDDGRLDDEAYSILQKMEERYNYG